MRVCPIDIKPGTHVFNKRRDLLTPMTILEHIVRRVVAEQSSLPGAIP
jgi:hypothetical protein